MVLCSLHHSPALKLPVLVVQLLHHSHHLVQPTIPTSFIHCMDDSLQSLTRNSHNHTICPPRPLVFAIHQTLTLCRKLLLSLLKPGGPDTKMTRKEKRKKKKPDGPVPVRRTPPRSHGWFPKLESDRSRSGFQLRFLSMTQTLVRALSAFSTSIRC